MLLLLATTLTAGLVAELVLLLLMMVRIHYMHIGD